MIQGIGVQTKNVAEDGNPLLIFYLLKQAGFTCCDFSLNSFLYNKEIYSSADGGIKNSFFDMSIEDLYGFFTAYKECAKANGIWINQMHMPYPILVPGAKPEVNDYLWNEVAVKSMKIAGFLECPNIVIHGFKLAHFLGSEEAEWAETEKFIDFIAPLAIENHTTICIENIYSSIGGHIVEGPCCDYVKAVERIDRINAKYGAEVLGFCFDTGHANLVGLDYEKFITALGKRLKVLHIHDNDGVKDLHQIPFTFSRNRDNTSSTDWEGFYRGLRNIDFDGVLSFETAPVLTAFPDEMKVETLAFIERIGEYMKNRISQDIVIER